MCIPRHCSSVCTSNPGLSSLTVAECQRDDVLLNRHSYSPTISLNGAVSATFLANLHISTNTSRSMTTVSNEWKLTNQRVNRDNTDQCSFQSILGRTRDPCRGPQTCNAKHSLSITDKKTQLNAHDRPSGKHMVRCCEECDVALSRLRWICALTQQLSHDEH